MSRLVIYGAGGFGREILPLARRVLAKRPDMERIVFAADAVEEVGHTVNGIEVISSRHIQPEDRCVIAAASAVSRRRMAERCAQFLDLVSDSAEIYDGVVIGEGVLMCQFSIVTADKFTRIGRHFHMNAHSTVGHDCTIGDFVTIGPKVSCNGNVILEDDVYLGCGSHIKNGTPDRPLVIGRGAMIGMGAIVTRDVAPGAVMVGNPARAIDRPAVRAVS